MTYDDFTPSAGCKATQCARLLVALKSGPITTSAARALLGPASSPAARVLDLRKDGWRIATVRAKGNQACYVLGAAL